MTIDFQQLEQSIGYSFGNRNLACQALTHPSFKHEHAGTVDGDYQRMEFLGDAVLGMLLAEMLYSRFPQWDEGDLSRFRAQLAGQGTLAGISRSLGLGAFIKLGRGEETTCGRDKDSILADVLEAIIAAVYQDGGVIAARIFVMRIFDTIADAPDSLAMMGDAKSELQELLSERGLPPPEYRLAGESGPPHERLFQFMVLVEGAVVGEGEGRSKKIAQQAAAAQALKFLLNQNQDRVT